MPSKQTVLDDICLHSTHTLTFDKYDTMRKCCLHIFGIVKRNIGKFRHVNHFIATIWLELPCFKIRFSYNFAEIQKNDAMCAGKFVYGCNHILCVCTAYSILRQSSKHLQFHIPSICCIECRLATTQQTDKVFKI